MQATATATSGSQASAMPIMDTLVSGTIFGIEFLALGRSKSTCDALLYEAACYGLECLTGPQDIAPLPQNFFCVTSAWIFYMRRCAISEFRGDERVESLERPPAS